jgi:hypothetical protein
MKGGAVFLLAILLGVFLAVGQCGSGSADEKDDDSHSNSSASDDHDDEQASDDDDSDDDKKSDDDDKDSGDDDSGSSLAEAMKQQLESDGLQVRQMSTTENDDCAASSYGEVRNYFSDHPCQGVQRAWYEVSDDDNAAVLSVAWVEMPDAEAANDLQRLVDRPGTGNVTELSKEDGPYQDVRYSGWYYRSDVDGATFRSVQAEPLAGNDGSREVARKASGVTATD